MIKLAEEKEMEDKEEKLRVEKEKQETDKEEGNEEETPKTAGEKRSGSDLSLTPPAKKVCTEEGETSSLACEVSSTSLHSSNGSSTSTKPAVMGEAMDEGEQLKLTEKTTVDDDTKQADNEKDNGDTEEAMDDATDVDVGEEGVDDTASKLLASGISVSLIKKKKLQESVGEKAKEKKTEERSARSSSGTLEVGPNISVTMIHKDKTGQERKMSGGLSVKSPVDLLETSKSATSQLEELKDSISVSRVQRTMTGSSPKLPNLAPHAPSHPHMYPPPQYGSQAPMGALSMGPPGGHGPMGMPGLHPRPPGSLVRPPGPMSSGPVSDQLSSAAGSLADYMRMGLEDLLREMSAQGSPQATIKGLQLELERMSWRHQQEIQEMKQNVEHMMKEMKANIEKENQRTVEQYRKQAELERQKAISETKKKQWCANCTKEAIFYCCWNTSYCDYPCQQAHWPSHLSTCSQANSEEEGQTTPAAGTAPTHEAEKVPNIPTSSPLVITPDQLAAGLGMPRGQVMGVPMTGFNMAGMAGGLRHQFGVPRSPMGLSIRPGVPGQLTISRPYFM